MKKTLSFMIVTLSLITTFFAEEGSVNFRKLTVEDAVMLAADNNISLQKQRNSLELLEKQNAYSWNSVNPSIKASGSYTIPFEDTSAWSMSGTLSLGLSFTPSLFTTINAAKLNYENGIESYESAVRTIELSVRKAFYSILYTKEYLNLLERNMETAKQRYSLNLDKYNRGQLSELDLLSSQYSYESLVPTFESSLISYENTIANFKQTLGLDQTVEVELDGNLEDYDFIEDFTIEKALEEIPSVKTIQASIDLAKNQLMASRFSAWGPVVSLSYSYGKESDASGSWATTYGSNKLGISVSIPLDGYLPWSSGALSIENQKTNLKNLELELENAKTSAELTVQNSSKSIMQAQNQLESLKKNVDLAQKTYDMTLNAYNHGSKDLLTLQNSADSLLSAKINLMQQKYTLISAVLDLENTLGIPFGSLGTK